MNYKENYPFAKKVRELFDKMEELGLTIKDTKYNGLCIKDEYNHNASIEDLESDAKCTLLPPPWEYKLKVVKHDIKE